MPMEKFFIHSGLSFLRQYGESFHLFDMFSNSYNTLIKNNTEKGDFNYSLRNYSEYFEWNMPKVDKIRYDLSSDSSFYPLINSKVDEEFLRHHYIANELRSDAVNFNNRFRYGPCEHQRFLTIVFDKDPWLHQSNVHLRFIRLVNDNTAQHCEFDEHAKFYCDFKIPPGSGRAHPSIMSVEFSAENVCEIPIEVTSTLTAGDTVIQLDFSAIQNYSEASKSSDKVILLFNIRVPRLHELDRRHFNVTVCTMVNDLHSPLLVEWLVYNIALGVEHFYLFDNRKHFPSSDGRYVDHQLLHSAIRPFLDANLVTLIYFPYSPSGAYWWNVVQVSTFAVMFHQFREYNKWVGIYDLDEFFLPFNRFRDEGKDILDILTEMDEQASSPSSPYVLLGPGSPPDAAWFNTVEMFCDVNGTTAAVSKRRKALTTHCFIEGGRFYEMDIVNGAAKICAQEGSHIPWPWINCGRGKMFVKADKVRNINYMHQYGNGILGRAENAGYFCHYHRHDDWTVPSEGDHSMERYAFHLLTEKIGLTFQK